GRGCRGPSHTRGATHGPAVERNAHPHLGGDGAVAVVHNGVIENYAALRRQLQDEGVPFHSDTDTEVLAQLIARYLDGDLVAAVRQALAQVKGTYGLAVISPRNPDVLVGARLGSPLVVGIGHDEHFLASDPTALVGNTNKVVYLEDHQLCVLTGQECRILGADWNPVAVDVQGIDWEAGDTDKGEFEHHMLKE